MIPSVNNQFDTALAITMPSKAEEIRQTSLHMIFELATELKEETDTKTYETVTHFRLMPVLAFIHICCSILDNNEVNAILKDLSLVEQPSSKMSEEAIKTNSLAHNTPHAQIKQNRVQILETALQCCRQNKKYKAEYLLRTLFINIVRLDPSSSWEEILKSIELEQGHLETVIDLNDVPGSQQEKYDCHLEGYLDLLSKLVGFQFNFDETLKNKFIETADRLEQFIVMDFKDQVSSQDQFLITKSLVFLYTRPEWLFYRKRLKAKAFLIELQSKENHEACKHKIELELILLQADQAIENQYIIDYPRTIYTTLLKNIIKILPSCSPSEKIMALSIGVKLYEALANDQADPNPLKTKILTTLKQIIKIGNDHLEKLDFRALRALAQSRFTYGFYLMHCFQTQEEFKLGCGALDMVSQDFWADINTRQAAIEIKDIHLSVKNRVDCIKLDQQNFFLLKLYKLLLQQELDELKKCFIYLGYTDKTQRKVPNLEDVIHQASMSQKNFSLFFLQNQFKEAENIIFTYLKYYDLKTEKMLESPNVDKEMHFYKVNFNTVSDEDPGKFHTIKLKISLDKEKIINFISKLNDYPFAVNEFIEQKGQFCDIDESQSTLNIRAEDGQIKKVPFCKSSIVLCNNLYSTVLNILEDYQGNLSYTKLTKYTMNTYGHRIWTSNLLKAVLFQPVGSRRAVQKMKNLRHDWVTLLAGCHLITGLYKFIDCLLPDDNEGDYYDALGRSAFKVANMAAAVCQSTKFALFWNEKYCEIAYNQYQHSLEKNLSSQKQALWFYLNGLARRLGLTDNVEEIQALEEIIDSCVPDTYEEIAKILVENQNLDSFLFILYTAYIKSICMLKKQRVEEGMALFIKLRDNHSEVKKFNAKKTATVRIPLAYQEINFERAIQAPDGFNPQKVKKGEKLNIQFDDRFNSSKTDEDDELQESDNCMLANPLGEKKIILQQANEILNKLKLKKEKKQARVTSCTSVNSSSSYASHSTGHVKVEEEVLPVISVKKYISKKCMQIFNCLWDENSSSNVNTAWELRSFKNNIKITREEALKLIQALGGIYTPSRGVGSHHVAHLPKIEFNGQDVGGLADYETGEFMITFTNDKELKHYQIIQLREMLITQGFNPDTVVENVKDSE